MSSKRLDFCKDVSRSPDAMISEIVKEIKEKQAEISSDSESESDLELVQMKPLTKIKTLHCLQTIRNYLKSISEATDIDYIFHCIKSKREFYVAHLELSRPALIFYVT